MIQNQLAVHPSRRHVVRLLCLIEDVVYVGLGILLSASALALLATGLKSFVNAVMAHSLSAQFVALLDQMLLVLLVIELLYTVQVSFREHALVAEPFLDVALIAVIRRILVLTAEIPKLPQADEAVFRHALTELALLAIMIVVLVGSLILMQRHGYRGEDEVSSIAQPNR
jgi:uncharacterized membrane protein (DUF373 family)